MAKKMKKIHKNCDMFEYVERLRGDVRAYRRQAKSHKNNPALYLSDHLEGEMCRWLANDLDYYLKHGKYQ